MAQARTVRSVRESGDGHRVLGLQVAPQLESRSALRPADPKRSVCKDCGWAWKGSIAKVSGHALK